MSTVGKLIRLVLKAWAASLKRLRSTVIRFSVPSSCDCRSRKFWVALSSGYFSTVDQQARQGAAELVLGLLELGEGRRVVELAGVDLGLADLGPGLGRRP